MTLIHICTTQSLRAGIDQTPMLCPWCNHKTMFASWVSLECDTCGADSESYASDCARRMRIKTGLTRKQIAEKAGLQPSTIKKYEWCNPSERYWNWFKVFVREFYTPPENKQ